jgi:hypothetical protein
MMREKTEKVRSRSNDFNKGIYFECLCFCLYVLFKPVKDWVRFSLCSLLHKENSYVIQYVCVCACLTTFKPTVRFLWNFVWKIMLLDTTLLLFFVSYHPWYKHLDHENFWGRSNTVTTLRGVLTFCMIVDLWKITTSVKVSFCRV